MKKAAKERPGFTLIELLVVMGIIMLLTAILLPAIGLLRKSSQRTAAKADVAMIVHAFKQYYNEYQRWPTNLVGYDVGDNIEDNTTGIEMSSNVVAMLSGLDVFNNNPRRSVFLHVNPRSLSEDGAFKDPWSNPYKYMCDFNYDGTTDIWFSNQSGRSNLVETTVAAWSRGRDESDEEGNREDDPASWK